MVFKFLPVLLWSFFVPSPKYHDFYISICYIKLVDGQLQADYRIFANDAETALGDVLKSDELFCEKIFTYLQNHFILSEAKVPLKFSLLKCLTEGTGQLETISCTLRTENFRTGPGELLIRSTVLLDAFDDQVNMFHVQIGSTKKSLNLDRDRKDFSISLP